MPEKEEHDGFLATALGRAEQAEAKQGSMPESAPTITYTEEFDSGRTFAISPQIKTILGYSQEEWMGDADLWIDRIHPDDRDRVVGACEQSNQDRTTYLAEYRIMAHDGRIVWVHDRAELISDSHGQPLCWQGVMTVINGNSDGRDE